MIRGAEGIRAPAEERSVSDGTILKLVLSLIKFFAIILPRRRPDLEKGACPLWFCGVRLGADPAQSLSEQRPFMTKQYKMAAPEPWEQIFRPASRFLATPPWLLLYLSSFACFPPLPISLLGILPSIIHEWHACFTRHVPTALLRYPEGVSTKPACNLLTHGAASSRLSSPITVISWTGPCPWHQVCCDQRCCLNRQTERSVCVCVCGSHRDVIGRVLNTGGNAAGG